jgi:hypothetical protein
MADFHQAGLGKPLSAHDQQHGVLILGEGRNCSMKSALVSYRALLPCRRQKQQSGRI